MSVVIEIKDLQGNILAPITFGNLRPGTWALSSIRIENTGDETSGNILLSTANTDWTFTGKTNAKGQEIVARQFFQVYSGGAWVPIGGDFLTASHYVDLGTLAASAVVDLPCRMVIPADAVTKGSASFLIVGSMV